MSFKRDGNNGNLLASLKRQRVGDLLVTHIPEDEALLLKNGKYACTVCHRKPIFDTLDMLAFHRRGKKHLFCLSKKLEDKQKWIEQKLKKKNDLGLSKQASAILPTKSSQANAYHPLLKAKPYSSRSGRKRKITLQKAPKPTPAATIVKTPTPNESDDASILKTYVKNIQKKTAFDRIVAKAKLNPTAREEAACKPLNAEVGGSTADVKPKLLSESDQHMANYYLKLRMSGWKKDWTSGNWIRDEDAEFESDDEEPSDYLSNKVRS